MNGKVATTEKLQRPECLLRQNIDGTNADMINIKISSKA
jgi:hypothetical protein